jgi:hypothetical protein
MKWVAFVAHVGEMRDIYKIFARKSLNKGKK